MRAHPTSTHRRSTSLRRRAPIGAAVLALGLALAGCSSTGGAEADEPAAGAAGGGSCDKPSGTVAVVSHGKQGDAFWDIVKKGAEAAGTDQCVKVTYQGYGDPNAQSQAIDSAVAQEVDGLVVSMANPNGVKGSVERAVAKGIPVVTINSGEAESAEFGALEHVGQSEETAGEGAGEQLAENGVTNVLCVIHEAGNIGLEERCRGAAATLGGTVSNLQVDVSNLAEAESTMTSALQADPSIDGVLTLNNGVGSSAVDAVAAAKSEAKVATFDVDANVVKAVQDGTILFAVDQQPYLQGYLPVVFLKLYKTNGNTVGGGRPVLTGPGFVTSENADAVAEYAARGTR